MSETPVPTGPEQFLYLTTRGRQSGLPREIEIWFTRFEYAFYVIAEHATSNWVRNLQADRKVTFRLSGAARPARARVLDPVADADRIEIVRQLSRDKYGWGEGLIVELRPC
jgi:deazaflavin-dependent oxidoreductase (nitroreductase family)